MRRIVLTFTLLFCSLSATAKVTFLNANGSGSLPFSEAVKVDNTLYLSGQVGYDNKNNRLVPGRY